MLHYGMNNIAIDTTFFGHEEALNKRLTLSTSIFTADILDAFVTLGVSDNFTLIVNQSHEDFFKQRFPQYKLLVLKWLPLTLITRLTKGKLAGTKYIKKLGIYKKTVQKKNFDLIWFPYTIAETYVKTCIKSVCTIHDLYRFHHQTNALTLYKDINNSDTNTIVTISDYTRQDIVKSFNYDKAIKVIPNSITFDVAKQTKIPDINNLYILDINAYIDKKNPLTLLKAFNLLKDKIQHDLVFCGGYKDETVFSQMEQFIKDNGLQNRVHMLFRVTDEERNYLLANAKLFVTPSLFEGFGRTPIEAAVCKIPVISTKETSLYEATMGLVNYYEPATDFKKLSETIFNVLTNPEKEDKLGKIAQTLCSTYTPQSCAKKYMEIFNAL